MLSLLAFQIISSLDCNFETAFQKGQQDVEQGSFGANVDRFCSFATDEARKNFPKYYELGRQHGPMLKKAGVFSVPTNQVELDALLKDANLSMTTKEIVDRISKTQANAAPSPGKEEIQNLTKRIESLEEENRKLSERLGETGTRR